jgi:mRNA interferase MazF
VAAGGGFGGKPRPALVIQADEYPTPDTVLLALFTSELDDARTVRPLYDPTPANGLQRPSELMADLLITARRSKVANVVGRLSREELARADRVLLAVLGLAS